MKATPSDLKARGIELFVLSDITPATEGPRSRDKLVGVVGGAGGKVIEGNELMRAVLAAKPDLKTAVRVALQVAQNDGEVLETPATPEQRKVQVRAPRVVGKSIVFWVWTLGVPRLIEQGKLDRTTGALDLAVPPVLRGAAITAATTALADPNVAIDASAIKMLALACTDPKVPQVKAALVSALGNQPRTEIRALVASALYHCGTDVIQPLINAMEQDKARQVRSHAATSLGRIGDGRARPALGKAAKSEDANLAWAARSALGKLK
jgi:HEAT repeats